jgi:hypothetical protein
MIRKASLKTTLQRRIKNKDFPIAVHRRLWAAAVAALIVPILLALAGLSAVSGVLAIPEYVADGINVGATGTIRSLIGTAAWVLMCPLCLIAAFLGIDRSFGYRIAIERDGLRLDGVLTDRLLLWQEIRDIRLKPRVFLPIFDTYQVAHVAIYVDGSNHPRRHWSSLWFGYYDIPPLMDYGAKELTALLRHAKRRADLSWPDAPSRKTRKSE